MKATSNIKAVLCALILILGSVFSFTSYADSSDSGNYGDSSDSGNSYTIYREDPVKVSEPGTFALFTLGLIGLGVVRRFRRQD